MVELHGSGATRSLWMEDAPRARVLKTLAGAAPDVCIVGAGMAGLSTAYQCVRKGLTPLIIDDGRVADGETARTTAHLASALDDRIYEAERLYGVDGARLAVQAHAGAIDTIEQIAERERIECDLHRVDGYLFLTPGEPPENLTRELEAAHRIGLRSVQRVPRAPLAEYDTGSALRFPRQGQFHPLRYMQGLAKAIERKAGPFLYNGHVEDVDAGKRPRVRLDSGEQLTADHVVLATNAPAITKLTMHTKQAPYRTFVVGLRVPADRVERALFWETGHPYHYVRTQDLGETDSDDEFLIVGGEDARTGQRDDAPERWQRLEDWARRRFPMAKEVEYRWSGQVVETIDGLAYLGRVPLRKNVYVITGDSGMGMTHTTIGSSLITDLILGRDNLYEAVFDPGRKAVQTPVEWAMEFLGQSVGYLRHLTPRATKSSDAVAPGQGAVVRQGLRQVAYYRDEQGVLNAFSAVCSHLGCVVGWNSSERSWDCPCHGSRFAPTGEVLNGPAPTGLKRLETDETTEEARGRPRRAIRGGTRGREGRIGEPKAAGKRTPGKRSYQDPKIRRHEPRDATKVRKS